MVIHNFLTDFQHAGKRNDFHQTGQKVVIRFCTYHKKLVISSISVDSNRSDCKEKPKRKWKKKEVLFSISLTDKDLEKIACFRCFYILLNCDEDRR